MPEIVSERVISVIGNTTTVESKPPAEETLKQETSILEIQAEGTLVTNDEEYQSAAEFGRAIKAKANEITAFFKPMKDAAHKAHKEVCEREKKMLEPLAKAEKLVKQAMGAYVTEQERKRKEAEEAARRAAAAEAERKLADAISLEEQGREDEAAAAIEEAEVIDTVGSSLTISAAPPKVKGVTAKKDYEIVSVDGANVPINFAGIELRPVDTAAVMRLIRASKGSIQIPGITYRETTNMSFSGR